jgi:hypothetical protein
MLGMVGGRKDELSLLKKCRKKGLYRKVGGRHSLVFPENIPSCAR